MSDSDDLTLTLTPPPAATYYAGAPFYRPNVRAANPGEFASCSGAALRAR